MRQYKYSKKAGALNEAAPDVQPVHAQVAEAEPEGVEQAEQEAWPSDDETWVNAYTGREPVNPRAARRRPRPAARPEPSSSLETPPIATERQSMFYFTVEDGQRMLMTHRNGRIEVVVGPARVFRWGKRFRPMEHHVAHPGEFLIVRFRDGSQKHLAGPAHVWLDPRDHLGISKEDCIQIAEKEAVVVYAKDESSGAHEVSRRIGYGPKDFVPQPGEWLHTFSWHGSSGGAKGYRKIPNALQFQKLWMLPDQMYHDVPDVRTADGVVLTIRLMLFFELVDIETMLVTTHDPIGDFVNAATSDVVDFVGKLDFDTFKSSTEKLNDLDTYRQLVARANGCGYSMKKVVYRGYGAPVALQKMHEQAMQARTKLQLEKATEEQAQKLADFQLERRLARASQEARGKAEEQAHDIALQSQRQAAELEVQRSSRNLAREQARLDDEQRRASEYARNETTVAHLRELRELQVDLTKYLTQGQADRVIELRGGQGPAHLHLDGNDR